MSDSGNRAERFKAEIADMRLRDPSTARDRQLQWVGVALMTAGVVIPLVAYALSHGSTNPLQQRDAIVVAVVGVALAVVGAALFLRYSLATFLRFWLARLVFEQQSQVDRLVTEQRASRGSEPPLAPPKPEPSPPKPEPQPAPRARRTAPRTAKTRSSRSS